MFLCMSIAACDRQSILRGQSNAEFEFFAIVVDQDGKPVKGAEIMYRVERVPKNYQLGQPFEYSSISAVSGEDGRFSLQLRGKSIFLESATRKGYNHLNDLRPTQGLSPTGKYGVCFHQEGFELIKYDLENPAVFVFVEDGVTNVHVVPCVGGYRAHGYQEAGRVKRWNRIKPAWPNEPSIPGVRYVAPATQESK